MGARPRQRPQPRPRARRASRSSLATLLVLVAALLAAGMIVLATSQTRLGGDVLSVLAATIDSPAGSNPQPIRFAVRPGQSGSEIGANLERVGLVDSAFRFQLIGRLHGGINELRAGEYSLRATMRPSEIIEAMRGGHGTGWVTFPEGWRIAEMADALDARGICTRADFITAATAPYSDDFLANRPAGASLEGYLFPDTYQILPGATADQIVRTMLTTFGERFTPTLRAQSQRVGLSPHQVVALASIVEREAVVGDERPLIAAVYLKRMQTGMKLQADPTVQYALAGISPPYRAQGYWKAPLSSADVTLQSPYNTYTVGGLPPGPIANPGLAAMRAVLEAPETEYLYFVARPDGRHAFARTYKEHEDNVARFQK